MMETQSHLVLGVAQEAEGDPPRIWPLVCAVRSSLRNFPPGSSAEDPRVPVVSCSFRCLSFAEFQQSLISFRKQNELQRRMNSRDATLGNLALKAVTGVLTAGSSAL